MEVIKPDIVVSLDVGSTYSGYAWQWRKYYDGDRGTVEMNTSWECAPIQIIKTKTCILIDDEKDDNIVAIGHNAEQIFTDQMERHNKSGLFFRDFKLHLYGENFSKDMEIEDACGRQFPLLLVMSKFIRALKDHFLDKMAKKGLNVHNILWVLTVPAIWPLESRDFMRTAAENGGIDGKSLKIALEPEVAAIYCLNLPLEERRSMGNIGEIGHIFLTADLGGGTADLTAIKVTENGDLDIICKASGSLIGGKNINDAFFQALHESFEGELWGKVFKNPDEVLALEDDFEQRKVNLPSHENSECYISLKIPAEFRDGLKNNLITMKKEAKEKDAFMVSKDKLLFNSSYVQNHFFKETSSRIAQETQRVLTSPELRTSHVNNVVLVGGLSESRVIVSQIETMLATSMPEVKVVVPTSPFRAILTGAVLFGHNPEIIHSRRSPATFGIQTNDPFNASIHKPDKKWIEGSTKKVYCKDVFSVHIREAEFVVLKEKQPLKTYIPIRANQTEVSLSVFMHAAKGNMLDPSMVLYTTDEGCTKLGELLVKMPKKSKGTNRNIFVSLAYGTEIEVRATDETSGESFETKLEFPNKHAPK